MALEQLDQKLWVALACPTATLDLDARTLKLLDADGDGRIRAPELIEGTRWAGGLLKNPDDLVGSRGALALAAIKTDTPEGQAIVEAGRALLKQLGRESGAEVSVAEASDAVAALHKSAFNGDGVITDASAGTPALKAALKDLLDSVGAEPDRSGTPGASLTKVEHFFSELAAFAAWTDAGEKDAAVSPLGAGTAAGRELLRKLEVKVDDYFARCGMAAFDTRAAAAMNREEKDLLALAPKSLSLATEEIAAFPLAHIEATRSLPLSTGVNPAWAASMATFSKGVVEPLLGRREALTEADWLQLRSRFAAFDAHQGGKQGAAVEKLGVARARELLAGETRKEFEALIAQDLAVEPLVKTLGSVERLVRLHRDLYRLCQNFVSFREFYGRKDKATFQAGTLYIDQRSCDLVIQVEDAAKHAILAPLARTYLAYCECSRQGKKMTIAAAFTAGDSDNLMVGRNGVFYDRQGKDWDATIIRVVDNPISVRQAFWSPYKKLVRFIEEQVAKRATDANEASNARLTGAAADVGVAVQTGKAAAPNKPLDIGIVAALGVAVGGIAAALGAMMQAFFGLGIWMPLGFVALILAISGPSMAIAWLKLRGRNLAPLLDANGWAMNAPARINIPFGTSLTHLAVLPPNAARELSDPYAEKTQPWGAYAAAAAVLALGIFWWSGNADGFLPENARKGSVMAEKVAPPAAAAKPGESGPATAGPTPP